MKKSLKILLVLVIVLGTFGCFKNNKKSTDGLKFKTEYEKLNGTMKEDGQEIRSIKIDENNPFVYITAEDLVKAINNKETFAVYFGFNSCPWCRSVLPTLVNVVKDLELKKVYYVDVLDIRDKYELKDGKPVKTVEGSKGYNELLKLLDNVLEDYNLVNENGKKISTKEKRIYAPNVVSVVSGTPAKLVTGISKEQDDPYMTLSEEMIDETYDQFKCALECLNEKKECKKTC